MVLECANPVVNTRPTPNTKAIAAAVRTSSRLSVRPTLGVTCDWVFICLSLATPPGPYELQIDGRSPDSRVTAIGHLPGYPVVRLPLARRLQLRGQLRNSLQGGLDRIPIQSPCGEPSLV